MSEERGIQTVHKRTVKGVEFEIHMLPPSRAIKLLTRLSKMIGEPFAAMAGEAKDAGNASAANSAMRNALPVAVRALVARLDENEVLGLVKELVQTAKRENADIQFERYFTGRLGLLTQLVWVVVEVQFGDFFADLTSSISEGSPAA